jgi:hypothetical protein
LKLTDIVEEKVSEAEGEERQNSMTASGICPLTGVAPMTMMGYSKDKGNEIIAPMVISYHMRLHDSWLDR